MPRRPSSWAGSSRRERCSMPTRRQWWWRSPRDRPDVLDRPGGRPAAGVDARSPIPGTSEFFVDELAGGDELLGARRRTGSAEAVLGRCWSGCRRCGRRMADGDPGHRRRARVFVEVLGSAADGVPEAVVAAGAAGGRGLSLRPVAGPVARRRCWPSTRRSRSRCAPRPRCRPTCGCNRRCRGCLSWPLSCRRRWRRRAGRRSTSWRGCGRTTATGGRSALLRALTHADLILRRLGRHPRRR